MSQVVEERTGDITLHAKKSSRPLSTLVFTQGTFEIRVGKDYLSGPGGQQPQLGSHILTIGSRPGVFGIRRHGQRKRLIQGGLNQGSKHCAHAAAWAWEPRDKVNSLSIGFTKGP